MKNICYRLILIVLLGLTFCANAIVFADEKMPIEDELIQSDYFKQRQVIPADRETGPITDELLNQNFFKDFQFVLRVHSDKYVNQPIEDELLKDDNFKANAKKPLLLGKTMQDEYFIEKNIDLKKVRKIKPKNKYDFTKKQIPIKIKIAKHLKSTKQILEGSIIPFIAQHEFEIKGKKYDSGTTILGRVETISASDKMGTPEVLVISNFYIPDKEEINLSGSISKTGANRAIWVYPLYQAGNIYYYAAGFIFVPIHGGRAKLLTSESFTVFYETQ